MSHSSKIEIYNMALGFCGTRTIGSPNESTPESIQCELFWDRARRSALRDYPYRFATRRLQLPAKELPAVYAQEWRYCYGFPVGVLRVVRVHDGRARGNKSPYSVEHGEGGEIILCDIPQAMADCTVDVTDISRWDETFIAAMSRKLAVLICVPLLKDDKKMQSLVQLYQAAIPVSEGADGSEAYDRREADTWLEARGGW